MAETTDHSDAVVHPPIAWALAFIFGVGLDWLYPIPFLAKSVPAAWLGGAIFALGFMLAIWAIVTIRMAGTRVETNKPTTAAVTGGPFRFTRNPIYIGMLLGQAGLAVGFNSLWILATLIALYFVIRNGVIAREETYLERKFGDEYLKYKSIIRRWL